MVIRTSELTIIENTVPEYCVVLTDTIKGWQKQIGIGSRCEQVCESTAEWIRSLFSESELERYNVSVELCRN